MTTDEIPGYRRLESCETCKFSFGTRYNTILKCVEFNANVVYNHICDFHRKIEDHSPKRTGK